MKKIERKFLMKDNYAFHISKKLQIFRAQEKIKMHRLSCYNPELNSKKYFKIDNVK